MKYLIIVLYCASLSLFAQKQPLSKTSTAKPTAKPEQRLLAPKTGSSMSEQYLHPNARPSEADREHYLEVLQNQADVVLGKEKRTLSLIRDVMIWYDVDPSHSEAQEKQRQLRQFLGEFRDEIDKLADITEANKRWAKVEDNDIYVDAVDNAETIRRKLTQLKAMGFKE